MLVEIFNDIFEDTSNNNYLNKLFNILEERFDLDIDYDFIKLSNWYKNEIEATKSKRDIIDLMLVSSVTKSPANKIKISNSQNNNTFSLEEAIKYLSQEFKIIFENGDNDSYFFEALLKNFPKESKKIRKHKDELWLKYSMSGGSIEDTINAELKSFSNPVFTKEKYKYLRCFVITDSDKEFPLMQLNKSKQNLKTFLDNNEVKYHFLEKREIENYLPDKVFEEIINPENRDFINAYLRIEKPEQKDFFDIEKGFPDKNFDDLSDGIKNLFRSIPDNDKKIFRKNNLKKINENNFKSEFPKLFSSEKVTKENLLQRTCHQKDPNELKNILKKITELL